MHFLGLVNSLTWVCLPSPNRRTHTHIWWVPPSHPEAFNTHPWFFGDDVAAFFTVLCSYDINSNYIIWAHSCSFCQLVFTARQLVSIVKRMNRSTRTRTHSIRPTSCICIQIHGTLYLWNIFQYSFVIISLFLFLSLCIFLSFFSCAYSCYGLINDNLFITCSIW